MHNNNQPHDKMLVVFGGTSYHNFKKVEEQGSLVDAHPKKRTVPIGEQHATFELEEVEQFM
jgi:hypothetical protein